MTKVTIAGVSGETTVEVGPEGVALGKVLETAAGQLGFSDVDFASLAPVVNGEDADSGTLVHDGDVVVAAPQVVNGHSPDEGLGTL